MAGIQFGQVQDGMFVRAERDVDTVRAVEGRVTQATAGSLLIDDFLVRVEDGWLLSLQDDERIGWYVQDVNGDPVLFRANGERLIGLAQLRSLSSASDDVWAELVEGRQVQS